MFEVASIRKEIWGSEGGLYLCGAYMQGGLHSGFNVRWVQLFNTNKYWSTWILYIDAKYIYRDIIVRFIQTYIWQILVWALNKKQKKFLNVITIQYVWQNLNEIKETIQIFMNLVYFGAKIPDRVLNNRTWNKVQTKMSLSSFLLV